MPSKQTMTLLVPAFSATFLASARSVEVVPLPSMARILPSGAVSPSFGCFGS